LVTLRGTTFATVIASLRERDRYDAVIGTTRAGALAGVVVSAAHQLPLIVDHVDPIAQFGATHGRWLSLIVQQAENIAFRSANATMFVYEEERRRVEKHASRTVKTALGVDYERFANPPTTVVADGRAHLPADLEKPVAVYIGGLEPIYNIKPLLAAGAELDSGSLVVAGAGSLSESVSGAAANTESIHYLGTVPHEEIPGLLTTCDVGVSLVDDPHTLKVLEYAAAGLPVVQLSGRAEARFGDLLTYTTTEPTQIKQAIATAAERDGTALQAYAQQFDWEAIAETYAKVIKGAVQ
jgi:glycosyltransferase involved in cell wall biosynthesis